MRMEGTRCQLFLVRQLVTQTVEPHLMFTTRLDTNATVTSSTATAMGGSWIVSWRIQALLALRCSSGAVLEATWRASRLSALLVQAGASHLTFPKAWRIGRHLQVQQGPQEAMSGSSGDTCSQQSHAGPAQVAVQLQAAQPGLAGSFQPLPP